MIPIPKKLKSPCDYCELKALRMRAQRDGMEVVLRAVPVVREPDGATRPGGFNAYMLRPGKIVGLYAGWYVAVPEFCLCPKEPVVVYGRPIVVSK